MGRNKFLSPFAIMDIGSQLEVFQDSQSAEYSSAFRNIRNSPLDNFMRRTIVTSLIIKHDSAAAWSVNAGNGFESCGLAGAVSPYDADHFSSLYLERHT
jgi:hypothetical protein